MDNKNSNERLVNVKKNLIEEIEKCKYVKDLEFIYIYLKEVEKKQREN